VNNSLDLKTPFQALSKSQIALNPNPKGVIQFIGSFVFGSFPLRSYKYLLKFLFDQGYTLIVYRFPFNPFQFRHWSVAIHLLAEQYKLRKAIFDQLRRENASEDVLKFYAEDENYLWLGHSLGCKYIILLEILSNSSQERNRILRDCLGDDYQEAIEEIKKSRLQFAQEINTSTFIRGQPSLFLAPEINNTFPFLGGSIRPTSRLGFPNREQTQCLICQSQNLFNLTGIIAFDRDCIAEDDVAFLAKQIQHRHFQPPLQQVLSGWHLEPLAVSTESLASCIDLLFQELKKRQLTGLATDVSCQMK
jgi:hypothetical protein